MQRTAENRVRDVGRTIIAMLGTADNRRYTEVIRHFYNDRDREIADFFITDSIMNVIRQDAIKQEKEHGY